MDKYINKFKIDISPQFEEKYKILCYSCVGEGPFLKSKLLTFRN